MTTTHFPTWLFFFFNLPSSHAAQNRKKKQSIMFSPPSTFHLPPLLHHYFTHDPFPISSSSSSVSASSKVPSSSLLTLHLLHPPNRYLPSFSSFEIFNVHYHQGHRYNALTDINLIINGGKRRSHGWCFWGLQRSRRTGHRGHNFLFLFALIPTPPDFRFDF